MRKVTIFIFILLISVSTNAQIYSWQTGEIIPGTENIIPGPQMDLSNWTNATGKSLSYANFSGGLNLSYSYFDDSKLDYALFSNGNLKSSSFTNSNLVNAVMENANLTRSDFLLSNLTNANLNSANLAKVKFWKAELNGTNLTNANLSDSFIIDSNLISANFENATINGTYFSGVQNFTKEQLYSTASYKANDLSYLNIEDINISDWNFEGQNLTNSRIITNSTNINLNLADIRNSYLAGGLAADLGNTILADGHIDGLDLFTGETLLIRDFDDDIEITIDNKMIVNTDTTLKILFEDNSWGSKISLSKNLPVVLNGTLELGFAPHTDINSLVGTTFEIFDWNEQLSSFDSFNEVKSDYTWDLDNLYSTGEVTLLEVPEPATALLMLCGVFIMRKSK